MKVTPPKNSRKAGSPSFEKKMKVRVPKDFLFLLMDKMVSDLAETPTKSGDAPILSDPGIDLSGVHNAIRSRNFSALLDATKPFSARSISELWADRPEKGFGLYQLHALLKKFPESGDTCAKVAYQTFRKYEEHCALYNRENWRAAWALNTRHPDFLGFIDEIREDIRRCIGEKPSLERIFDNAKHGPGTAVGMSNPYVTPYFKWSEVPYSVSPQALPYAREAISRDPRWIGALNDHYYQAHGIPYGMPIDVNQFWDWVFEVVDYCQYSTVPKSAETDRSIGIEPRMNVYIQLGVDGVIRHRLKNRWGIDLNTQVYNQIACKQASLDNEDATLDLKGASDCIAQMAAYLLLPSEWFNLLMDLRSEKVKVSKKFAGGEGECYPLQKMSAMGNGFTFVLESLIFAAICRYCLRKSGEPGNLCVFGDDLIVPKRIAPKVIEILGLFGFMVNEEKSFITGPFRESCGVDYLRGINIRPFFLKRPVVDVTDIWYILNSLAAVERRLPEFWEVSFANTKTWLYKFIPQFFRDVIGPVSESMDTYLHVERMRYDRNGLTKHKALVPVARTFNKRAPGFFYRKLMVSLRRHGPGIQELLRECWLNHLRGEPFFSRSECEGATFGSTSGGSAFDVTLRDVIKYNLITRRAWREPSPTVVAVDF